jgi:DNA-binding XRE family transcriptional regulator
MNARFDRVVASLGAVAVAQRLGCTTQHVEALRKGSVLPSLVMAFVIERKLKVPVTSWKAAALAREKEKPHG